MLAMNTGAARKTATEQLLVLLNEKCRILHMLLNTTVATTQLAARVVAESTVCNESNAARRRATVVTTVCAKTLAQLRELELRVCAGLSEGSAAASAAVTAAASTSSQDAALGAAFDRSVTDRIGAFAALRDTGVDFNKMFVHGLRLTLPLSEALRRSYVTADELEWLITTGGADPCTPDATGTTPLDVALAQPAPDAAKLRVLLQHVPKAALARPLRCGQLPGDVVAQLGANEQERTQREWVALEALARCVQHKL
jgi:hypothetical protein